MVSSNKEYKKGDYKNWEYKSIVRMLIYGKSFSPNLDWKAA